MQKLIRALQRERESPDVQDYHTNAQLTARFGHQAKLTSGKLQRITTSINTQRVDIFTPDTFAFRGASTTVTHVAFAEEKSIIAAGCDDGKVLVYIEKNGCDPKAVFDKHHGSIVGLVSLTNKSFASVSSDGILYIWNAETATFVSKWQSDSSKPVTALSTVNRSNLVVAIQGEIVILSHVSGAMLKVESRFKGGFPSKVSRTTIQSIKLNSNFVLSSSNSKSTVQVWDSNTYTNVTALKHKKPVSFTALSQSFIVLESGYELYVYNSSKVIQLESVIKVDEHIRCGLILDEDILCFGGASGCLSFLSLTTQTYIVRMQVSDNGLKDMALLPDGRIVAVGENRLTCIVTLPPQVSKSIEHFICVRYPNSEIAAPRLAPLRHAWNQVRNGTLTLMDACNTVITKDNCKRSLDEWCFAHFMLMEAVNAKVIPSERRYKGAEVHWYIVLYQHCAKLAMGEKDISFVISLLKEAEDAGVVAIGTIENFIDMVNLRRDIEKDKRCSANAMHQLFIQLAQMDDRLQHVIRYQHVQQLTAIVNAILDCIPFVGGDSVASPDTLDVDMLVESLLDFGTGQKTRQYWGDDELTDRFLLKCREVLSVGGWSQVPLKQKQAVKDVVHSMGMTMRELRERLESTLRKQSRTNYSSADGNDLAVSVWRATKLGQHEEVEPGDDTPSNQEGKWDDPLKSLEKERSYQQSREIRRGIYEEEVVHPRIVTEHSTPDKSDLCEPEQKFRELLLLVQRVETPRNVEPMTSDINADNLEVRRSCDELLRLKQIGIDRNNVSKLQSTELAAVIAAFMVNYERNRAEMFSDFKQVLEETFKQDFICGVSITDGDVEVKIIIRKAIISSLSKVVEDGAVPLLDAQLERLFTKFSR